VISFVGIALVTVTCAQAMSRIYGQVLSAHTWNCKPTTVVASWQPTCREAVSGLKRGVLVFASTLEMVPKQDLLSTFTHTHNARLYIFVSRFIQLFRILLESF
jgi:hypothetical protein